MDVCDDLWWQFVFGRMNEVELMTVFISDNLVFEVEQAVSDGLMTVGTCLSSIEA